MKTKILHTRIWEDGYFSELTPTEKLVFLYYVFNERNNQLFCYECPDKYTCIDTGINKVTLGKIKQRFLADGKIAFFENWVFLVNANKYEQYKGEKNEIAKGRLRALMSKDVLDWYNSILDRGIDRGSIDTLQKQEIRDKSNKERVVKGKQILDDETFTSGLKEMFPDIEIKDEIEKMKDWLDSNGKTKSDYKAFARNWLRNTKPKATIRDLDEIIVRPERPL